MSSQLSGQAVDLGAVTADVVSDAGVAHGARLLAFTDAVMRGEDASVARERRALVSVLSPEAFVDVCGLIAAFNVVDRVADATGIPLDPMMLAMSGDIPQQLRLARFGSAANTPGAA